MMSSKFQTKPFKALQEKWYKKLKDEGFKDVEQDENHLKEWDSHAFVSRYSSKLFASKQTYFELAGQFVYTYKFKTPREKLIWELHAEGKTITQISTELKRRRYKTYNRSGVHIIIQSIAKVMLKQYDSEN